MFIAFSKVLNIAISSNSIGITRNICVSQNVEEICLNPSTVTGALQEKSLVSLVPLQSSSEDTTIVFLLEIE